MAALICFALIAVVNSEFLKARKTITTAEIDAYFEHMLSASQAQRLARVQQDLQPLFTALPKNPDGTIESATVRYALHRHFVHHHGWYMKGIDPAMASYNGSLASTIMADKAPSYIQAAFEHRLKGKGMNLRDLAVFVETLTDLIQQEATRGVEKAFKAFKLPLMGDVGRKWTHMASKAFFMILIMESDDYPADEKAYFALENELPSVWPGWDDTYLWMADMEYTRDFKNKMKQPFRQVEDHSFSSTVSFVEELTHKFGRFQNIECHAMKEKLMLLEDEGTGRVPMSRFYSGGLEGDWSFTESEQYLRNLGAIDDSDPSKPSVVIPNYLMSQTNCLSSSGFYSICCSDQCEGVMRHVEESVGAATASPSQLARIVSALPSDTVDAPRNLSSSLERRLHEISTVHGGAIPLHGRLFSQWMHHAYPRECPFPHLSGTVMAMTPWEWMDAHGADTLDATVAEMQAHNLSYVERRVHSTLPWSSIEELITDKPRAHERGTGFVSLRSLMAIAALGSLVVPLVRATTSMVGSKKDKVEAHFV